MIFYKRKTEKRLLDKYTNFYIILDYWLKLYEDNKTIDMYFKQRGYKKIAVYGMGVLGKHLEKQLCEKDISIEYVIDKGMFLQGNYIMKMDEVKNNLPNVDVIVVTAIMEFENIERQLKTYMECPIISLEEVVLSI